MIHDDECRGGRFSINDLPASIREEWRRRANARHRTHPTLGGEPMDGIDYVSDDLRDLRIAAAMHADWTPAEDARAEAAAEQIGMAMRDAERWDSRRDYPELRAASETIRRVTGAVVSAHRTVESATLWSSVVDPVGARGNARPFDPDDPQAWRGVFGIWAGAAHKVHVLRAEYSPAEWVRTLGSGGCDWVAPLAKAWNDECFGYSAQTYVFARGQYLVALRTCQACHDWLAAGAPEPARQA